MDEKELQLLLFGWYDEQVAPDGWKGRILQKAYLLHCFGRLSQDFIQRFRAEHDRITLEKALQKNTFRDS